MKTKTPALPRKLSAAARALRTNAKLAIADRASANAIRDGKPHPTATEIIVTIGRKEIHPDCECGECAVGHFKHYLLPVEKWGEVCAALELGGATLMGDKRADNALITCR